MPSMGRGFTFLTIAIVCAALFGGFSLLRSQGEERRPSTPLSEPTSQGSLEGPRESTQSNDEIPKSNADVFPTEDQKSATSPNDGVGGPSYQTGETSDTYFVPTGSTQTGGNNISPNLEDWGNSMGQDFSDPTNDLDNWGNSMGQDHTDPYQTEEQWGQFMGQNYSDPQNNSSGSCDFPGQCP
jgi:hypothetical protein